MNISTSTELFDSSVTSPNICSQLNDLTNSTCSPVHQLKSSDGDISPLTPKDNSTELLESSSSPSKRNTRVKDLVDSLVGDKKLTQKGTHDRIEEIDSYINKILEKLKIERSKLAEIEATRSSLKSLLPRDNERIREQENLSPKITEQSSDDQEELNNSSSSPSNVKREKRTNKESSRTTEKDKKGALAGNLDFAKLSKYSIDEVLQISIQKVNFGAAFPGKVIEESLEIVNKTSGDIVVQIFINCLNPELKDSEEYTYSIRRNHLYDYNDKHYLIMSPFSSASFKLALKAPSVKLDGVIAGECKIGVQGVKGASIIPMESVMLVPKIVCPKELYHTEYKCNIIKLAIKQGKKQETKFPLKNLGDMPVTLDLSFYQPKNVEEDPQSQCLLHPSVVTIPPQGTAIISIGLKSLKTLGRLANIENKSFKKVLIGTAKNSVLMYSFLLWIEVC